MPAPIDLTGQRFGRLVAQMPVKKAGKRAWECVCDCGGTTTVGAHSLRSGNSTSCGCRTQEARRARRRHGKEPAELYQCWLDMKKRCYNPKAINYSDYGGRGIQVCEEWIIDYIAFRDFALANGWRAELFIDRRENDGNYDPGNCRFVDRETNNNNSRHNRLITWNGETKTVSQWAVALGIKASTIRDRLHSGWDEARVLAQPVKARR